MLDFGLFLMYALIGIAALGAIVFALLNIVSKPGGLVRALIGIGALLAVFFISYLLSGGDVTAEYAARGVTEGVSKVIGGGLIMFYITLIGAVAVLVFTEVSKGLK